MMKMATGEGSPSGRVPEQAPERFLVAREACGGGTLVISSYSMVFGYKGIYRRKKSVGGASRGPRGWRARPRGMGAPPTSWLPRFFPDVHCKSIRLLSIQK